MKKAVLSLMMVLVASIAFGQSIDELMSSAERLREANNENLALTKYEKVLEQDPDHYEALHSASLMASRVGARMTDEASQSKYYRKADEYADRAIKANPTDAEGHFVKSVSMGRIALISGSRERVAASTTIKEEAETALRYNPKHAGAWHILGRWNVKVANLSFAEKAAANTLFGGLPKGASNENAIRCYQNALKYKPNYILYMYDLAGAFYTNKQTDKARETLNALLTLKPVTADDPGIQKEAKAMLNEL